MAHDRKSIQRIIELLGGHWGQIDLEKKYEFAERALYKCNQESDESADSYLARADIMWTELNSKKFALSDLQAYVTLRSSVLSPEDKKRVLVDADVVDKGELTVKRVSSAIRMLGAGFFQEITAGKRTNKLKTYDQATLVTEDCDDDLEPAMAAEIMEDDEQAVETLAQEGDDDATLVMDFENAAAELLQTDEELASAYTAYTDARRRLNEKVRSRGFWPSSFKGKSKNVWKGGRLCNQVGHWKAECPSRRDAQGPSARTPQAPTTFAQVIEPPGTQASDALPMEFLNLPVIHEPTLDVPQPECDAVCMTHHEMTQSRTPNELRDKLQESLKKWKSHQIASVAHARNEDGNASASRQRLRQVVENLRALETPARNECPEPEPACFASHGSLGIVDLGATKTVIGSKLVPELLGGLDDSIRSQIKRCPCVVTFRFGNHGVLQSQQAIVVPLPGLLLKIAVVPGSTPFLLSNTLLRALGATIDTSHHMLHATKIGKSFPLNLTSKGLFLLDLNDLAQPIKRSSEFSSIAETHASTDSHRDHARVQPKGSSTGAVQGFCEADQVSGEDINTPTVEKSLAKTDETNRIHQDCQSDHSGISESSDRSKPIPRSFKVISRSQHGDVHTGQSSAKVAADSTRSRVRFQSPVHGEARDSPDQVWKNPCGQNLSPHVGERTTLDPMVLPALQPKLQVGSSRVSPLCGDEDREMRTDGNQGVSSECHRTGEGGQSGQSSSTAGSHAQGQGHDDSTTSGSNHSVGPRGGSRALRDSAGTRISNRSGPDGQSKLSAGRSDAASGERPEQGDHLHRAECCPPGHRTVSRDECPSVIALQSAGDVSADCTYTSNDQYTPESNRERDHFLKLLNKFTKKFTQVQHQHNHHSMNSSQRLDLLEVFCGPQSQLTHQSQQLGYKAERFSHLQGDLQTCSGRNLLFQKLVKCRPKNVWFSPTCGPWSGFSCLNGSKSVEAWDDLQQVRLQHLEQVALGVVILRFQRQNSCHMHWEQPRGSIMLKLPYLQEVRFYMLAVDIDLCIAGNLKDPSNGLHIKKALTNYHVHITKHDQRLVRTQMPWKTSTPSN